MNINPIQKIALILLIIIIILVFYIFDIGKLLTLSNIKDSQNDFKIYYSKHKMFVIVFYMAFYILITSISLPGAAILTLAGGAFFGLWIGTLIVSISSTIGAMFAYSISRFLLRDWVINRFEEKLKTIDEGIRQEGAFYLFSLRLIPVFPFFVINSLFGLTKMPLITFAWISQIGMLPGTIVFVNAGKEIAKIKTVYDILSPSLILSFILLGIFPLIVKKMIYLYKTKSDCQK